MARSRRIRRYYRKKKWNIENRLVGFSTPNNLENGFRQNSIQIVPPSTLEGVRKVGRFTVTITAGTTEAVIYWALIYVPEGLQASSLFPDSTTLFNPSNYVLGSGVNDSNAGPIRIRVNLFKNLNANDQIYLLTATTAEANVRFEGLCRYAICFN